jgi:hypothetical protein
MDRIDTLLLSQNLGYTTLDNELAESTVKKSERLPFTIKVVSDLAELEKAVQMRRSAYGRHLPEFAETMGVEALDAEPGTVVLLAQSRLDGGALGTMRVQTNAFTPLAVEQSVRLPDWLRQSRLAEATRLGVSRGAIGRMVKVALCKAYYMYCAQNGIDWMMITARSPLDREYEAMLFGDVFGQNEFLPMSHVGGMPHRVMAKPVALVRQRWAKVNHPFYGFFFETDHVDIDVCAASKLSTLDSGAAPITVPADVAADVAVDVAVDMTAGTQAEAPVEALIAAPVKVPVDMQAGVQMGMPLDLPAGLPVAGMDRAPSLNAA